MCLVQHLLRLVDSGSPSKNRGSILNKWRPGRPLRQTSLTGYTTSPARVPRKNNVKNNVKNNIRTMSLPSRMSSVSPKQTTMSLKRQRLLGALTCQTTGEQIRGSEQCLSLQGCLQCLQLKQQCLSRGSGF